MFTFPEVATKVTKDKDNFDVYLFEFPDECLKKVIFGSLMPLKDKNEIGEIVKRRYPSAEILEAVPSETHFDLKFKPFKI